MASIFTLSRNSARILANRVLKKGLIWVQFIGLAVRFTRSLFVRSRTDPLKMILCSDLFYSFCAWVVDLVSMRFMTTLGTLSMASSAEMHFVQLMLVVLRKISVVANAIREADLQRVVTVFWLTFDRCAS